MKTILLWDPRFPERRPARLSLDDAVASAAVRAGCATAANPAEAGLLGAGEPLDPGMLTEVVVQQANGTLRRAFLPYSVVIVGASAGIMASIGTPVPGGFTPTPTPTLTLSPASPSVASNAAAGTLVSSIGNVPMGFSPTVTPNDGRLVIAGDASAGWKVVIGTSALSAGTVNFSVAATGAVGASAVLTVTAAATPVNATTFAESSRNERFLLTPANMTSGNGLYFPHVIDVRNHPLYMGKVDWIIPISTDHGANGSTGIWLYFCVGDDFEFATVYSLEQATSMGLLSRLSSVPAANPVISDANNPAGMTQIETPWVMRLPDNTFSMTFQINNVTGYRYTQATFRATSTDCVNWTMPTGRTVNDALLTNFLTETLGDGHTGYPMPWANVFPDGTPMFPMLVNPSTNAPYKYLMVSLAGGTDYTSRALWGSDDAKSLTRTGSATRQIRGLHQFNGVLGDQAALTKQGTGWIFDAQSVLRLSDGSYTAIMQMATNASGATDRTSTMVEIRFMVDSDGIFTPISKPKVILAKGPSTGPRGDGAGPSGTFIDYKNKKWHALYTYRDTSTGGKNAAGRISGPLLNPDLTKFDPLPVDITKRAVTKYDFRNLPGSGVTNAPNVLPSGMQAAVFGTTNLGQAGREPSAKGTQLFVKQDTGARDSEAGYWPDVGTGINLRQHDMVDMFVTGVLEENVANANRTLFAGFSATSKVQTLTITDGVFASNKGAATPENGISSLLNMHWRVGSTAGNYLASDQHYGIGAGTDRYRFLLAFGWRIYTPSSAYPNGRLFLLGEGRTELTELPVPANWDWDKPLFPFFSAKAVGSGTTSSYTRTATFEVGRIAKAAS